MLLSAITLSDYFLTRRQNNWPGDPSPAANTTGKNLQETHKKPSTQ